MKKGLELEIKVGMFVTLGVALIMVSVLVLGGADTFFSRQNSYYTRFTAVDGLIGGAKVMLHGIRVGVVTDLHLDPDSREIKVEMSVEREFGKWIRQDSVAEMSTQGVLGDKYISIVGGSSESPELESGSMIQRGASDDLNKIFSSGQTLLGSLNSIASSLERLLQSFEKERRNEIFFEGMANTARNLSEATAKINQSLDPVKLKSAVENLNGILEKINNGTGSLGALVNDPALYYDAKSLLGGANRNRIMRNLVRKTLEDNENASDRKKK